MDTRPFDRLTKAWLAWRSDQAEKALATKIATSERWLDLGIKTVSAAHLAGECGEAGAPRLIGSIRQTIRNSDHLPDTLHACLLALRNQGLRAGDALGEIGPLCNYHRGYDGKSGQHVRETAIETLSVVGHKILLDPNDWYLPNLGRAMQNLLNTNETLSHTLSLRLRVFGELGNTAIQLKKTAVEDFFIEHFKDVKNQAETASSASVRRQAALSLNLLQWALRETHSTPPQPFGLRQP